LASALSSDKLAEAGHPLFATKNRYMSVAARWSRASLVTGLVFSFVLLVFGCKASLFHPRDGLRCRVARIEVSHALSPKAHRSASRIRGETEHAKNFYLYGQARRITDGHYERYECLDISSVLDCLLEEFNPRSPPSSIQS
jgi:hypothetical protein